MQHRLGTSAATTTAAAAAAAGAPPAAAAAAARIGLVRTRTLACTGEMGRALFKKDAAAAKLAVQGPMIVLEFAGGDGAVEQVRAALVAGAGSQDALRYRLLREGAEALGAQVFVGWKEKV